MFVPGAVLSSGGFGSSLVGPIAATAALYLMTAHREALKDPWVDKYVFVWLLLTCINYDFWHSQTFC